MCVRLYARLYVRKSEGLHVLVYVCVCANFIVSLCVVQYDIFVCKYVFEPRFEAARDTFILHRMVLKITCLGFHQQHRPECTTL